MEEVIIEKDCKLDIDGKLYTMEEILKAVRKTVPKTVKSASYFYGDVYHCPECQKILDKFNNMFCPRCGQALEWE